MAEDFRLTLLPPEAALLEPGPGIDPGRPAASIEAIVRRLQEAGAQTLYYDLAEVVVIDATYLAYLNHLARACSSVGARMICIHIRPETAFGLVALLASHPREFETAHGIERATGRRD